MPGRRTAVLDIEQPQEELAQRAVDLEAHRLEAVVEAHIDARAEIGRAHLGRQRELELEDAPERGDALVVARVDRENAPAARAKRRRGQLARAAGHLAPD